MPMIWIMESRKNCGMSVLMPGSILPIIGRRPLESMVQVFLTAVLAVIVIIMPKGSWAYPLTAVRVRAVMAFAWVISVSWLASGSLWKSALLKMNAGPCCRYAVGERAGTILWRRLMSGMISAENGRLAAALAGTGLMVDGRSGPGLTWLIIFDFLIIKKTKPLSHLSQCGSGFVA